LAVRSVFVFPAGGRDRTVALLDAHLPQQRDPWVLAGGVYVNIVDEQTDDLFIDWAPDEVAVLEAALGYHPSWAAQIDVSGCIDGTVEVHHLLTLLLEHGGVAIDDCSPHPWTLPDIRCGVAVAGLRFFDFRR
jgi:hypothetical protein